MAKAKGRPKRVRLEDRPQTKLSSQQVIFCDEYIKDYNGTQAAIRAGYSENGASVQATRLLANAKIKAHLEQLIKDEFEKRFITREALFNRLDNLSKGNMLNLVEWDENQIKIKSSKKLNANHAAAIKTLKVRARTRTTDEEEIHEIETEIGLHDVIKATELLMKGLKIIGADETQEEAKTGKKTEDLKLRMKQLSEEYKNARRGQE